MRDLNALSSSSSLFVFACPALRCDGCCCRQTHVTCVALLLLLLLRVRSHCTCLQRQRQKRKHTQNASCAGSVQFSSRPSLVRRPGSSSARVRLRQRLRRLQLVAHKQQTDRQTRTGFKGFYFLCASWCCCRQVTQSQDSRPAKALFWARNTHTGTHSTGCQQREQLSRLLELIFVHLSDQHNATTGYLSN